MQKNEQWIGTCTGYAFDGTGVVKKDGIVFFVKGLMLDEVATLAVTKMKKNYGYARIVELMEPSVHRVDEACSCSKRCGGCPILYMDRFEQNRFKTYKVKECFKKNAKLDVTPLEIMTTVHDTRYRNKVVVPVRVENGVVQMGFYQAHSNTVVEFEDCLVQTELSNVIIQEVKGLLQHIGVGKFFRHVLIKHAHQTNEVMVCFIVKKDRVFGLDRIARTLASSHPEIKSIMYLVNERDDNVILDGKEVCLYGNSYIEEELLGQRFRISMRSFFQINPYATAKLYQTALDYAKINDNDVVIDLYCGTGTIGLLAAKRAKKVYGIEIVEEAIVDAKINAKVNGIENVEFFALDAKDGAKRLNDMQVQPDVVIVDPPRKGCSKETMDAIFEMSPERVVYVSCDPATLARDVKYFLEHGYSLQVVQPVDLFPNTVHVETIVLLTK